MVEWIGGSLEGEPGRRIERCERCRQETMRVRSDDPLTEQTRFISMECTSCHDVTSRTVSKDTADRLLDQRFGLEEVGPKREEWKHFIPDAEKGLHHCTNCEGDMVQPVNWDEMENGDWSVHLHCPECDRVGQGIFSQATVDRFDKVLDEGGAELLKDVRDVTRANMQAESEVFVDALERDLILPEDF